MGIVKEFKDFAMRGNVLDLAVGVIIGGAFNRIVNSFVNDVLMPPLGLLVGGDEFSDMFLVLRGPSYDTLAEAQAAGVPTLNYGIFINNIVDFLIVAFAVFLIVRWINRLMRPRATPEAPSTKQCPFCYRGIPTKATRCPECTSDLTSPAAKQATVPI